MDNKYSINKKEFFLYAFFGVLVLLYPFISAGRNTPAGDEFEWAYIWQIWRNILPFVILMLVHIFLLLPILFKRRHRGLYFILFIVLTILFFAYSYYEHEQRMRQRPAPRQDVVQYDNRSQPSSPPPSFDAPPAQERKPKELELPERGPRNGRIARPVIFDTLVAILLLVCSLAIRLIFKHYEDSRKMEELEKEHIRQELLQLKAQVSPHFFMNSLNNIHGMVEIDPVKAQDMILELSGMMRYVLYDSTSTVIPLSKEIEFLKNYIALLRVRYPANRLDIKYSFPTDEQAVRIHLSPLIFIIFIENAFKHGVSYLSPSFIDIELRVSEKTLTLHCKNTLHQPTEQKGVGGVGLQNIRKRLDILYGKRYMLDISKSEDLFLVTLEIPIKDEN